MIELTCTPSSSLDWDLQIPETGSLFWRFDLGLEAPFFPIDDPMHFEALKLGLKKFTQELWPKYKERTRGAILYRGTADFSAKFSWSGNQTQNFETWKQDSLISENLAKRLFCADAFVHYFQMLAFSLPDELPIYLLLDADIEGTLAEKHHMLSKERFEHFEIAITNLPYSSELIWNGDEIVESSKPPRALCFPTNKKCSSQVLEIVQKQMNAMEGSFRVIPEAFLNEKWDEVDELYVLKEALSDQGQRMVKGFEAAGGKIVLR